MEWLKANHLRPKRRRWPEHAQMIELMEVPSFYTEPAGSAHFARTGDEPAIVYITGVGPTDTVYVDAAQAPH